MSPWTFRTRALGLVAVALTGAACTRDLSSTAGPAPFPNKPSVFADVNEAGVDFQPYGGSKYDALSVDATIKKSGASSLKITIPSVGDPSGAYAGGAFVANVGRDLSSYNALTFWARASVNATLDVAGIGDDNTGTSKFRASSTALAVSPTWKKYTLPIPDPAKLTAERGMFYFAEGPENGAGYDLWFDDIKFETVANLSNVRPLVPGATVKDEIGGTVTVAGTSVIVNIGGTDQTVTADPRYFAFTSSNSAVATVSPTGVITLVGAGSTSITGKLGATNAAGTLAITAVAPPAAAPAAPTRLAANVISLLGTTYTNVPVDTWSASWDQADVADVSIAGTPTKKYTNLAYAGIEFTTTTVNATAMSGIHLDLWTLDAAAFKVKLVDFGANGIFGGGDDSEHEVTLSPSSSPSIATGVWNSLDIPFSAFTGLTGKAHIAQMIIAGSAKTDYLANVHFYKVPVPVSPPTAAPTPTRPAANVISLNGGAYTNVVIDTWLTGWSNATETDVTLGGHTVRKYSSLVFAGIEAVANPIDATAMTNFHMDIWTPSATAAPAVFKVKIVDFGANGAFGGGDDVEHELTFSASTTPALATGSWVALDVPLSAFTGLVTRGHLAQFIISGDLPTVFVDNVYFYTNTTPTSPLTAGPLPTYPAGNVISLSSRAYTTRAIDTFITGWSSASETDVPLGGATLRKYTNLVFAGMEAVASPIDASTMTHVRMDIWTPDPTGTPNVFKIKLVDFGANGTFQGGDDVEHELTFSATSTPSLSTGSWVTLDIPLSQFTGLTTKGHIAQIIISGTVPTVYVDNLLFHK